MRFKLGLTALLATFALLAPSAAAVVVHKANGHFLSLALRRGVSAKSVPGSVAAQNQAVPLSSNGNLNYHGGPVLRSNDPYLIFWVPPGETMSNTTQSLLERYFGDVAADSGGSSDVYGVDRQFTDAAGFADYKQTFGSGQAIVDAQAYPAVDTVNCSATHPKCVTDGQLQAELTRVIGADGLPTDGSSSASELNQNAPIYFIVLPSDVNVCLDSADCADNAICAYHSSFVDNSRQTLYAAIPLLPAAADPKACQADGNIAVQAPNGDQVGDVAINYTSHEDSETVTDPLGTGWWNSSTGFEDGDECSFYGGFSPSSGTNPNAFTPTLGGSGLLGTLYNQSIAADRYYTQSEWSNGDVNCELRPSAGTVSSRFSVSSGPTAGAPVTFDPAASSSSNGYSSVSWSFGDGATSFDKSGAAPSSVAHTYSAAGTYTVTLTLVDPKGNIAKASHQVTVTAGTPPPPPPVGGGTPPPPAGGTPPPTGTGGTAPPPSGVIGAPQQADELPTAAFALKTSYRGTGQPLRFDATASNDPDGSIVAYAWNFGDGTVGTGASASHAFARPGTYTVTLGVADSAGLTASTFWRITVVKANLTRLAVRNKTKNGATILVTLNAPGKLFGVGKAVRVTQAGISKLNLKLTGAQHGTLVNGGRLAIHLTIRFAPSVGRASTHKLTIRF